MKYTDYVRSTVALEDHLKDYDRDGNKILFIDHDVQFVHLSNDTVVTPNGLAYWS